MVKNRFPSVFYALKWLFIREIRIERRLLVKGQRVVRSGPFLGMKLPISAYCSKQLPKMVGCYELELQEWLEAEIVRCPKSIIDIGCAEGYYAAGLAMRCPNAKVIAYDESQVAMDLCSQAAVLNNVQNNISIRGRFVADDLKHLELDDSLVICDVEGFESEIFTFSSLKYLKRVNLLIECHDVQTPHVSTELLNLFADTHDIQITAQLPRDVKKYARELKISKNDSRIAVNEGRIVDSIPVGQIWLYLTSLYKT